MRAMLAVVLALATCGGVLAQSSSPYLVSPDDRYLGNLNRNRYDPNSVANPYGQYGSRYSADSINNPYGKYGSPYSDYSARNPYATQAPRIYAPCVGFNCD